MQNSKVCPGCGELICADGCAFKFFKFPDNTGDSDRWEDPRDTFGGWTDTDS
jgi:hypothetical protein